MKKIIYTISILIIFSNYVQSQISGFIYDEVSKEPLWGVSTIIPCLDDFGYTGKTVETDIDGFFYLKSRCSNGTIMISFPGYANKEVAYQSENDKKYPIYPASNLDTIYLKRRPLFSNYEKLEKSEISGFIYDEALNEPLGAAYVMTYCQTDSLGYAGTLTNIDGYFNFQTSCKKGKIRTSYIGYEDKEVAYQLENDKIHLDTISMKAGPSSISWEEKSVPFNPDLKGRWDVVYFTTNGGKEYFIDEEDTGYYYFKFFKDDYDLDKFGSFFYCSGFRKDHRTKFRLTKNNTIEFRTEPYVEAGPYIGDVYIDQIKSFGLHFSSPRENERLEFRIKFYGVLKLFRWQTFRYALKDNRLFITNGIDTILLMQSKI